MRPAAGARPGPKQPKTAEELDKELDAFMGDSEPTADASGEQAPPSEAAAQDVEMV